MSSKIFGLVCNKVILPDGIRSATVLVDSASGKITAILPAGQSPEGVSVEILDDDCVLMAGLVDSHVHINEPGRTEWEGFESATKAAAAGGITTVADMPLNSNPVTTTLGAFHEKLDAARGKLFVDCAFFGGVVPGNTASLQPMIEAGVVGFKCFLIHSGIDDFPNVAESDLHAAMPVLARNNVPLLVHAELEHTHDHAEGEHTQACDAIVEVPEWADPRSYMQFLQSRPRKWEDDAIRMMLELCRKFQCPVHIVHLSSADLISEIRAAVQSQLPFTVETCPHYLTFAAEEIPDGDPRFKCAPPIRERENREKLWAGLRDKTIDIVVSDHSPCSPSLKFLDEGDLKKAWGGISSLQFRLPAIWTEAKKRGFLIEDVARWLCQSPAEFLGLGASKGRIAVGCDADFVIWQPEAEAVVKAADIHHKHKVTPYEGRELIGKVKQTYLRGRKIWDGGKHIGTASGDTVLRSGKSVHEANFV